MDLNKVAEKQNDKSKDFLKETENKVVVVFGEPMVGKTTFLRKYVDGDKTIWFKIDKNYTNSLKSYVVDIENYNKLLWWLDNIKTDKFKYVVIDSLTSLSADFLSDKMFSPRKNVELANFYDVVFRKLSLLKEKGLTIYVIAHEAIKQFQPLIIQPKMNLIALRHVDLVYRIYKDEEGKRHIKKWEERTYDGRSTEFVFD